MFEKDILIIYQSRIGNQLTIDFKHGRFGSDDFKPGQLSTSNVEIVL